MKHLILSAVTVISLLATGAPAAQAQSTVKEFKEALSSAIGTKKGGAAINAAARVFGKAIRGNAPLKNKVFNLAKIVNTSLAKLLNAKQQGTKAIKLVTELTKTYFSGKLKYNAKDRNYTRTLSLWVKTLPKSEKKDSVVNRIANPVISLNSRRGGSADDENFLNTLIFGDAGLPIPPPVS